METPVRETGKWVVLPHYGFAALAFLVLNVLLLCSTEAFSGHYFHPKLLTLTHVAALDWATMLIFGALYQLLPVILQAPLYSEKLAKITFGLLASGTVLLAFAFWHFSVGWVLQLAACLLVLAFACFNLNIYQTARKAPKWTIAADFIITSGIWLLLTGIAGLLMALNFTHPFLPESHLHYLKLHAHFGMGGWFLLLIIGAGSKLLPMFLLSHPVSVKKLHFSYYLINAGLLFFAADQLFFHTIFQAIYGALAGLGVCFFGLYIAEAYRKRVRKRQDAGMRQSLMAVVLLALPVCLLAAVTGLLEVPAEFQLRLYLVYGLTIFMGFLTALILGQTFKTLPFIVWMHRYRHLAGKEPTPQPKELYSEKLVRAQNTFYLIGFGALLAGVAFFRPELIRIGGALLLLTSLLYALNVFKLLWLTVKR